MILNRKNVGRGLFFSLLKIKWSVFSERVTFVNILTQTHSFANQNDSQQIHCH